MILRLNVILTVVLWILDGRKSLLDTHVIHMYMRPVDLGPTPWHSTDERRKSCQTHRTRDFLDLNFNSHAAALLKDRVTETRIAYARIYILFLFLFSLSSLFFFPFIFPFLFSPPVFLLLPLNAHFYRDWRHDET